MKASTISAPLCGRILDTIAQSETSKRGQVIDMPNLVRGNGTPLSNMDQLKRWAKKKTICTSMILPLVDTARSKGDFDRMYSYWNAFRCLRELKTSGGRAYGDYCKNRFCPVCCGIRKAEIMGRYLPVLKSWKEPFFLTLTLKSPDAENLRKVIHVMFKLLSRIIAKYRKRALRGGGLRLIGVKSFECTYNPKADSYHPHFHLILPDLETADTIRSEWIREGRKLWGEKAIHSYPQWNVRIKNVEKTMVEILKYSNKILTSPDVLAKKKGIKSPVIICIDAYDNIIAAMKGKRIFERFGFNMPPQPQKQRIRKHLDTFMEWRFSEEHSDWLQIEGELTLTGYETSKELEDILQNRIIKAQSENTLQPRSLRQ